METPKRDGLDDKVNRVFAGKAVRKDLVRKVHDSTPTTHVVDS